MFQDGAYAKESDMDGLGLCPYDPRHNSTAVFVGELQIPIYFRLFILEREIYRVKTFFPAVKCIYIYSGIQLLGKFFKSRSCDRVR